MKRRLHRRTDLCPQVSLSVDNEPVINLCGIQPLLSEGGFVRDSHIIHTGRRLRDKAYEVSQEQVIAFRRRFDAQNECIMNNIISQREISDLIVRKMWDYGKHYKYDKSLEEMKQKTLMYNLDLRGTYIRLTTIGHKGNFIISSNTEVFGNLTCYPSTGKRKVVFVDESLLPKNCVIVGAHPLSVYANPLVACPIIPKEELEQFCLDNALDTDLIVFDKSKQYPFLNMMLDWYEIYDLYLRHVGTNKWYLEEFNDFNTIQDFYNIIHFQEH